MASKFLLVFVLILDFMAVGLAIAAEFKKIKGWLVIDSGENYEYCIYGSGMATGFGISACLLLMSSRLLITLQTRRLFCAKQPLSTISTARPLALFIASLVIFCAAEACLIVASVRNSFRTKYATMLIFMDENLSCQPLRRGVFAAGAGLAFLTAIASALYYVSYNSDYATANETQPDPGHVAKEVQVNPSVIEDN